MARGAAPSSSEAAPQASIMHPSHCRCKQNSERPHRGDCSVLNEWFHAVLRQLSIANSSACKQAAAARRARGLHHHCINACSAAAVQTLVDLIMDSLRTPRRTTVSGFHTYHSCSVFSLDVPGLPCSHVQQCGVKCAAF